MPAAIKRLIVLVVIDVMNVPSHFCC